MDTYDYLFKVLIIGESSVGKSSVLFRYTDKTFSENFLSTIGVDFRISTLTIKDQTLKLQLWDTAGQDRYRNIVSSYYRGASGIILIYDITNKNSFNNLDYWLKQCNYHQLNCAKLLVGNKLDLHNLRQVQTSEGKELADKLGMGFIETSAKDNVGINQVFEDLSCEMLDKKMKIVKEDNGKVIGRGDIVKSKQWCCV